MRNLFTLHQNYTVWGDGYQVVLPLNLGYLIPADDAVRLLSQFVERMFLGDLYQTYRREGRKGEPTPRQMLKAVLYAYMNHHFSSREMECACRRDINFMWLLEGAKAPGHATIARFRSLHFALCAERIMAEFSEFLHDLGEISGEVVFIDGTKIEACANKYTFVWKKAVTKNMEKRLDKLAEFVGECETLYGLKATYKNQVKMKHVKKLRKKLYALKEAEGIEFVHGKGKRKSPLQKSAETLEGMEKDLPFHYTKIVTDAGYESEENYHYLAEKERLSYIKPANYGKAKTRKYQDDIGRAENMEYDEKADAYTCHNGKRPKAVKVKKQRTKSGYGRETTVYTCEDCKGCPP